MNSISIIGNITKEIELRQTNNGKSVSTISIAYNDGYGDKKETYFFDVNVWGNQADNLKKYCGKGSKVAIEGKLIQQTWQNDKGENRSKILINAYNITFLDSKDKGQALSPSDFENMSNSQVVAKVMEEDPFADAFKDFGDKIEIDNNFLD